MFTLKNLQSSQHHRNPSVHAKHSSAQTMETHITLPYVCEAARAGRADRQELNSHSGKREASALKQG